MNTALRTILAATFIATLGGCEGGASSPVGKVAMIDLQRIARALGRDELIRQQASEHLQQMNEQIQQRKVELDTELIAEREKLGENPTQEQQVELARRTQAARQTLQRAAAEAEQHRRIKEAQLIQAFRDDVSPYVQRTTKRRGFTIAMTRSDLILAADPAVDITDEVITEMTKDLGQTSTPTSVETAPTTAPSQQ